MATNKNKTKSKSTKSKSNVKKPQNKKYNKNNKRNEVDLEVYAIGLIAVSFVLFISVYISSNFIITSFIKSTLIGLFGIGAYIIPFVIFILGSLMFLKQEKLETKKYVYITISFIITSAFFQTVTNTDLYNATNDTNFVTKAYTSATYYNGGLVGATVSNLFVKLVGKILTAIILLFSFIYLQILLFNYSFSDIIKIVKEKIEHIKFQDEDINIDDYKDDDIDIDNEISNLNIEKEIVFSSSENTAKSSKNNKNKNIQNDEINGKRAPENVDNRDEFSQRNNELNSKNVKYTPKSKPTINVKKKSVFGKKPKVRIFDFSTIYSDKKPSNDPLEYMEREEMLEKFDVGDGIFVNVKKNKHDHLDQNYQDNYQNNYQDNYQNNYQDNQQNNYQDNYEDQNYNYSQNEQYNINNEYIQPNQNNDLNNQKELAEKEETIKSLKEELDRQMFLFQDAQIEFIEQKKLEKSLLKIINAQRDTIEKLVAENKAYENIHANIVNAKDTTVQPVNIEPKPQIEPEIKSEIKENINENINENVVSIEQEVEKVDDIKTIEEPLNASEIKVSYDGIDNILEVSSNDTQPDEPCVSTEYVENINDTYNNDDAEKRLSEEDILNLSLAKIKSEVLNNEKDIIETVQPNVVESNIVEPVSQPDIVEIPKASTTNTQSIFDAPTYNKPIEPVKETVVKHEYKYPTVDFLVEKPVVSKEQHSKTELLANSKKLEMTLKSFGVVAKVLEVSRGPSVTRYEVQPGLGVKVSKIANLSDDLALNLSAKSIRIQAPIPGKPAVGIEVPNEYTEMVYLREVLDDENFRNFNSKLAFGIGKDIAGKIVVADLATMPHLLIAGATGSGKSVCVNTLITSIIYKSSPDEVKLLMIDPKVVELSVYNGIPHLLIPVVTDPKKAAAALNWAVREMEKRYKLFSDKNVRDLKGYNRVMTEEGGMLEPQIVIIIDELADLMMTAAKEVEAAIIRLAQMARAAGIHLIIATQRPSVDVITGIIKANIPSRLAFAVSSGIDSKTILDTVGAEKLLGKGDMLFSPMGSPEPIRIQGAFISDKEVESIVEFLKTNTDHEHMKEIIEEITSTTNPNKNSSSPTDTVDEILEDVVDFIITQQKASTSLIQRRFRVGFNRAARIVDELENFGVIGPDEGNKPRRVLMTHEEWDNKFKT